MMKEMVLNFMNRDELILSFTPILEKLVLKYNNHIPDEDLLMLCYVETTRAVDRSLSEGLTDKKSIQNRVIRWCSNALINEVRVIRNVNKTDIVFDELDDLNDSDYSFALIELKTALNDKENKVLDMRLNGYDEKTIKEQLNIGDTTYHNIMRKIKKIILD